jgi:membrane-associated phospholipid phosphatase
MCLSSLDKKSLAAFLEFMFQPILVVLYGAVFFLLVNFVIPTRPQSIPIPDLSVVVLALLMASICALIMKKIQTSCNVLSDDAVALTSAVALAVTTVGFSYFEAISRVIVVGAVGVMAAILVGAFVRMFFRISGHMLMLSFVITGLVIIVNWLIVPAYLLLLPVAWCRLSLRKHTVMQVFLGTVLGVTVAVFGYWALSILKLL